MKALVNAAALAALLASSATALAGDQIDGRWDARLTHNGIEAQGRPWPRQREGRPSSTCVLGLCESWTEAR